jgi:hypothetical protein
MRRVRARPSRLTQAGGQPTVLGERVVQLAPGREARDRDVPAPVLLRVSRSSDNRVAGGIEDEIVRLAVVGGAESEHDAAIVREIVVGAPGVVELEHRD